MIVDLLLVAAGLVGLVLGGDWLVKGAVNLALRLGIAPLIVGLTVVAFGTSAPELLVSLTAALGGQPGLAIGNVVGSNIANVLLVLGLPAVIAGIVTKGHDLRADWLAMMAVSVLLIALAFTGTIGLWGGLILLAALAAFLGRQIMLARRGRLEPEGELEGAEEGATWKKISIWLVAGLIALPLGAQALVAGASDIARTFGVSEAVIGLTLVAVGTSLPELATSVAAALRGRADMALGNVVGSNIFNISSILGVTALVTPLPIDAQFLRFDLWVMLAVSLLLAPFLLRGIAMTRTVGIGFLAAYAAYVWVLL